MPLELQPRNEEEEKGDEKEDEDEGWQDSQCSTITTQERTGTSLCNACVKIFLRKPNQDRIDTVFYRHIQYLNTLERSASHGCELCNHVLQRLRSCEATYLPTPELCMEYHFIEDDASPDPPRPESLWICFYYKFYLRADAGRTTKKTSMDAFLVAKDDSHFCTQIRSTNASPNIDLFKAWMSDCLTNHTKCARFYDNSYIPSRLLQMSADADDVCHNVRLIETSDQASNLSYMALSHCWGEGDFLKLTTENLSRLLSGFDITELPRTFSDAIYMTHRLGVEYLWIDSLCIIQDSDSDWEREAFSMKKVYSNAMCTIAATGARNAHQSLHRPEGDAQATCHIPIETSWRSGYSRVGCLVDDIQRRDISGSPLLKRAWVIQEMALSPRKLHFARSEVHWQCQERVASEALPHHYPRRLLNDEHRYRWPENRGAQDSESFSSAWWSLVSAYSSGRLTKNSDKLAAFAGAAEHFGILSGGLTYTCGMWRENMPSDLLWRTVGGGKRSQRYRAPSWSWLSLDNASVMNIQRHNLDRPKQYMVEILDVTVENLGQDAYGPVNAAALQMKGLLKRMTMVREAGRWCKFFIDDYSGTHALDDSDESTAGPVYFLPFYMQETRNMVGLVLKPAVDGGPSDQFRRVGIFSEVAEGKCTRFLTYQDDDGLWKPIEPTTFTLV